MEDDTLYITVNIRIGENPTIGQTVMLSKGELENMPDPPQHIRATIQSEAVDYLIDRVCARLGYGEEEEDDCPF